MAINLQKRQRIKIGKAASSANYSVADRMLNLTPVPLHSSWAPGESYQTDSFVEILKKYM